MKRTLIALAALALVAAAALTAHAQKPKSVPMHMYHIVLAKEGPNWKSQGSEEGMDVRMQVVNAVRAGAEEGLVVSAGLVNDETDVEFIVILDVETKTEAYNLMMSSPNVKNGFFKPEIYSYFGPEGLVYKR
jgi:hypothetical protein